MNHPQEGDKINYELRTDSRSGRVSSDDLTAA